MTPERHCGFIRLIFAHDQGITLVDATVAALAVRMNVEVWTYDHHFDAMEVRVWR
jgi:predicted nucleic acid-binding protein